MAYIRVTTEIPGPRARHLLARREAAVPAGLTRATDVVVERAEGGLVVDVDGNTLLDFAGGIGMLAVGHAPRPVVRAIEDQARKLIHVCTLVASYEPYVHLAELLNEIAPGTFPKKTLLTNSGAESVENAVKVARRYTGRPVIICFEGGYHGRTLLTLSLTGKYATYKTGFGPFAPEIVRLPVPQLYRTPKGMTEDQYIDVCIAQLENALTTQAEPSAVAAMIIEPVQGESGFIVMPPRFLRRIRELCDRHGIVMIADEVQCGFGRTGRLFAIEHYDIVPDVVVTAKSLGAGMPIAAVTGRADIMDAAHSGGLGGTYGGSPVACAAAIEAVNMIRQPEFLAHARRLGEVMRSEMSGWKAKWPLVGDVRGLGPMMIAELVRDRDTKEPATDEALAVAREAVAKGVILIRAGLHNNGIRLLPPLTIPEDMLNEGLDALGRAIEAVAERQAATVTG